MAHERLSDGNAPAGSPPTLSSPVAEESAPRRVLFTNVNVFDGVDTKFTKNGSVLVEGNLIKEFSTKPIDAPNAYKVDGGGRTLSLD